MPIVQDDRLITRAVGQELRRARHRVGWTRPELVKRMNAAVPVNTYACYEQGIRQCSIPRLVQICRALGVAAPELLSLALQRAEVDLHSVGMQVDLHKITSDNRSWSEPLRRWARNRLDADPRQTRSVKLEWSLIEELGPFFGVTTSELVNQLKEFAPDSAVER